MIRYVSLILWTIVLVVEASIAGRLFAQDTLLRQELIVCGWDEVFVLDFTEEEFPRKVWSWRAVGRADLPAFMQPLLRYTDECKPVDDGRKILVTSSSGGVALIDRVQDRVLFYGRAANAHSADLLPRNRLAVAASHDPQGRGDRLILFDVAQPDRELWSEELPWGHGVVWDRQRNVLWALGDRTIRLFRLRDWETDAPKLDSLSTIPLPEGGGHDLSAVSGSSLLTVTTSSRCWLFDRDTHSFTLHPELSEHARVKSLSIHPITNQAVYVQAEGEHWWAERLHFLNPGAVLYTPGEHYYKARWNLRAEDSP